MRMLLISWYLLFPSSCLVHKHIILCCNNNVRIRVSCQILGIMSCSCVFKCPCGAHEVSLLFFSLWMFSPCLSSHRCPAPKDEEWRGLLSYCYRYLFLDWPLLTITASVAFLGDPYWICYEICEGILYCHCKWPRFTNWPLGMNEHTHKHSHIYICVYMYIHTHTQSFKQMNAPVRCICSNQVFHCKPDQ